MPIRRAHTKYKLVGCPLKGLLRTDIYSISIVFCVVSTDTLKAVYFAFFWVKMYGIIFEVIHLTGKGYFWIHGMYVQPLSFNCRSVTSPCRGDALVLPSRI
jgi:hypothetical protein